MRETPY